MIQNTSLLYLSISKNLLKLKNIIFKFSHASNLLLKDLVFSFIYRYYLRFMDPRNSNGLVDKEKEK